MKLLCAMILTTVGAAAAAPSFFQDKEDAETKVLIGKLVGSKHSLLEGIAQAEKENGLAISAKFEFEDGKLNLSVYTAKQGRGVDAEHNTLMELGGDASAAKWTPEAEVFKDKEHLTRSATHLTLMQLTKMTLAECIEKAAAAQKGTVYSAIPAVKAGKAVVNVLVAAPDGKSVAVSIDVQTGKPAN